MTIDLTNSHDADWMARGRSSESEGEDAEADESDEEDAEQEENDR